MKKYLSIALAAVMILVMGSCKKSDFDYEGTGEAVGSFRLSSPADNSMLMLNSATPNEPIVFRWTEASKGVNSPISYTWKLDRKTGDFTAPLWALSSDNNGSATQLTVTHKSLDSLLATAGIAGNAMADLKWIVEAKNPSGTVKIATPFNLPVTRFGQGLTRFTLYGPLSSTNVVNTNPSSTTDFFTFKWQKTTAVPAAPVTYKVVFVQKQYDANNNPIAPDFSSPLFSIASNVNGTDTVATISWKQMSDSLSAHGLNNLSIVSQLQWTVVATAGGFSSQSAFFNDLFIAREVKVYIVGSATPGDWDISKSTRLIEDPRFPGTYFTYIRLIPGEFKFVNGQQWPPTPGAVDWGQDPNLPSGNITDNNEANIPVSTAGVYRVTLDLANNKWYAQTAVANGIGGMGMIGQFQGWSQPAVKMSYVDVNKFIYLTNMNTNDEFKFHDGNDWDNSANNKNRWYATVPGNPERMVIDPGAGFDNFKYTGPSGRMRAIWDGSNTTNLQYSLTPASEMRVVGNGINMPGVNDWDPGSSPQMTYTSNGIWTATLTLKADMEIKFLAGNAWGAFDYEDNSGQSNALGTPRPIKWDGGPNFKTPAVAGTYTITLNEYTQRVTIN